MLGFVGAEEAYGTLPIRRRGFRTASTSTDSRHDSIGQITGVRGVCNTGHTAEFSQFLAIGSRTFSLDEESGSLYFDSHF